MRTDEGQDQNTERAVEQRESPAWMTQHIRCVLRALRGSARQATRLNLAPFSRAAFNR